MLKVEVCAFSGLKIYPGHGKRVCRADGKTQIFLSGKCERNHALKRNPRKVRERRNRMGFWVTDTRTERRKAKKEKEKAKDWGKIF